MSNFASSMHDRDVRYFLHAYTDLRRHEERGPTIIARGEGVHVYDDAGKRYIEGLAGMWCAALGFGEERLVEAAAAAMRRLGYYHNFNHMNHELGIELAERVIELAPVPMSKVFFTNSGSEANDTLVKLIWYYNNALGRPGKKKIIARRRAYHGVTVAAASLTGIEQNHRDFDLPIAGILHTDCPSHFHGAEPGESEEAFATRLADNLERLILDEGPETVAAMFAEPVIGGGGVFTPPATYFEKVQAVLARYDVLLVADEVICGFGRTGNWFGCETVGARPDSMSMAKNLSAGYQPIAALAISEPIYRGLLAESDKVGGFAHGFTYGGHPVCCAVALEALRIYEEIDLVGHVRKVAPHFQAGFHRLADHPLVGDVRGVGLIAAIELARDKRTRALFDPADGVGAFFARRAQENGLILRCVAGTDIIALAPPLVISEAEIDEMHAILAKTLEETEAMAAEKGLAQVG